MLFRSISTPTIPAFHAAAGTSANMNAAQAKPKPKSRLIHLPNPGDPDPATDFVTVEAARLSEAEFRAGIAGAEGDGRSIRLFVHGYNNSFQETVYRLAQITADAHDNRVAVLFAWPSKARTLSYSADKAAAGASTDGLARTIEILAVRPRARVVLLAHSRTW